MKAPCLQSLSVLLTLLIVPHLPAQDAPKLSSAEPNLSLKMEIERAIAKGTKFLLSQQNATTGAWSDPEIPAFTALALSAIQGAPGRDPGAVPPENIRKGYAYLVSHAQPDGGIYAKGLGTYNTALSLMALMQSGDPAHIPVITGARRYLISIQNDFDTKGESDNVLDGGIGYAGNRPHSDLSNTMLSIEALYYAKKFLTDVAPQELQATDLDWDAAISFVSRCQNSEKTVKELGGKTGLRKEDEGGFVYFPGDTKAGEVELPDGKVALRSYASMTYAGMLSFIYADMSPEDPRIKAALTWLGANYSLTENPGMGAQGLFYYYNTMAKALGITGMKKLPLANGEKIPWAEKLALQIFEQQQQDGSWKNAGSNRWMEDNPILVTAYSLLALEHIYRTL